MSLLYLAVKQMARKINTIILIQQINQYKLGVFMFLLIIIITIILI